MDKEAAGRLADEQLGVWQRSVTYGDLAYADEYESSTSREVTFEGTVYDVTSTVWRERGDAAYTMSVRVSESGRKSFFAKAVSRHGRYFPDGRSELGL